MWWKDITLNISFKKGLKLKQVILTQDLVFKIGNEILIKIFILISA